MMLPVFLLFSLFAHAEKVATLPEIVHPYRFVVDADYFYISQGVTVFVYSARDYQLLTKFGKEGEGPGEILLRRRGGNDEILLDTTPDHLIVSSVGKVLYFSRTGEFIRELRTEKAGRWLVPVGDHFAGKTYVRGQEGDARLYHGVVLFDKNLEKVKEIYRHLHGWQGVSHPFNPLTVEQADFKVADNKIFVINGGLSRIMIFDLQGKMLGTVTNPGKRIRFTAADKERMVAGYQHNTFWKQYYHNRKQMFKFPKYFPPILWFDLDRGAKTVYVATHETMGKNRKYFIFDFNGKLMKEVFIPTGGNLTFYQGKLFRLVENDNEEWDLYITQI